MEEKRSKGGGGGGFFRPFLLLAIVRWVGSCRGGDGKFCQSGTGEVKLTPPPLEFEVVQTN